MTGLRSQTLPTVFATTPFKHLWDNFTCVVHARVTKGTKLADGFNAGWKIWCHPTKKVCCPNTQLYCLTYKFIFLTNVPQFKKKQAGFPNICFISKIHCYCKYRVSQTNMSLLFVLTTTAGTGHSPPLPILLNFSGTKISTLWYSIYLLHFVSWLQKFLKGNGSWLQSVGQSFTKTGEQTWIPTTRSRLPLVTSAEVWPFCVFLGFITGICHKMAPAPQPCRHKCV